MQTTEETKPDAGVILAVLTVLLDQLWSRFYSCVLVNVCAQVDQAEDGTHPCDQSRPSETKSGVFFAAV